MPESRTSPPGGAGAGPEPRSGGGKSNATGYGQCQQLQTCPNGACLYNIFEDPTEHDNLSGDPAMAHRIAAMRSRLAALEATYFNPARGSGADGLALRTAQTRWQGYWGPFVFP